MGGDEKFGCSAQYLAWCSIAHRGEPQGAEGAGGGICLWNFFLMQTSDVFFWVGKYVNCNQLMVSELWVFLDCHQYDYTLFLLKMGCSFFAQKRDIYSYIVRIRLSFGNSAHFFGSQRFGIPAQTHLFDGVGWETFKSDNVPLICAGYNDTSKNAPKHPKTRNLCFCFKIWIV